MAGEPVSRILRISEIAPFEASTYGKHSSYTVSHVSGVNSARITGTRQARRAIVDVCKNSDPAMKLTGRYKGARRRRELPIIAECACGWHSRPLSPQKAERRYAAHVIVTHGSGLVPTQKGRTTTANKS